MSASSRRNPRSNYAPNKDYKNRANRIASHDSQSSINNRRPLSVRWYSQNHNGGSLRTSSAQSKLSAIPCTNVAGRWSRLYCNGSRLSLSN